ncbi:hypothetical protein A5651_09105 [Mycobacterium sp. 1274761.0]|nr:hypothetical protein A5651_09105 [Mycobacterium sp. 1274761.0]
MLRLPGNLLMRRYNRRNQPSRVEMSSTGADTSGLGDYDIRRPLDPNADSVEASEFSWGAGLEPPSVRGKRPAEGGRYRGTTPDCEPRIAVGGNK